MLHKTRKIREQGLRFSWCQNSKQELLKIMTTDGKRLGR